jgi:3',5'-cyclic AMP phosphodiesterase CpdA
MLIAHLSDVHFGAEDKTAISVAAQKILCAEPDLIIVSGDLTQRGKRVEFAAAKAWLDQFPHPILCTPGNHDVPLLNMISRAYKPFSRYARFMQHFEGPARVEAVTVADINTSRGWQFRKNWAEGSVDLEDLETVLSGTGAPRILTCHHPLISSPQAPLKTRTRRGARASELVAKSQVELLLTGHVHKPSAEIYQYGPSKYLAISCGTLSERLRSHPPSFNFITLANDTITLEVIDCDEKRTDISQHLSWSRGTLEPITD